mmetsp:Transcript_28704/g.40010  ORF Transcript_28704/g.40010 Transcript_28704/m.40010 type:complete len:281 (-) Transcript_28704:88-930(-)
MPVTWHLKLPTCLCALLAAVNTEGIRQPVSNRISDIAGVGRVEAVRNPRIRCGASPETLKPWLADIGSQQLDSSSVSEKTVYNGPFGLVRKQGDSEYLSNIDAWRKNLPARLENLSVTEVERKVLSPNEVLLRWNVCFLAPIPLPVRIGARSLPPDATISKEDPMKLECKVDLMTDLKLDENGRIYEHNDVILNSFGIDDVISVYNFLMASRTDQNLISWYLDVNSAMTRAELREYSDEFRVQGKQDFDNYFLGVILRNFAVGVGIPLVFYAIYKIQHLR